MKKTSIEINKTMSLIEQLWNLHPESSFLEVVELMTNQIEALKANPFRDKEIVLDDIVLDLIKKSSQERVV